ncbi:hypothetical protein [Acidovorax sp.]|uniref:hypothetical protein n=1 Tax=Acidovorax sp. TaxID=1872122 RepID=UPI002ACD21AD|nr:hypothetical protein [Acidovorax sp.]MDZ7862420.1 hypothetical protein [Acidovorax sp.]
MKRLHPMTALACWLGVVVLAVLLTLVYVVSEMHVSSARLDAAHLAGMAQGATMCPGGR